MGYDMHYMGRPPGPVADDVLLPKRTLPTPVPKLDNYFMKQLNNLDPCPFCFSSAWKITAIMWFQASDRWCCDFICPQCGLEASVKNKNDAVPPEEEL